MAETRAVNELLPSDLLSWSHQLADIRMRSHRLLRLDDNKFAASCQQAWCKLIFKTFYSQAWCKLFQQLAASLQISSCNKQIFTDLMQLDEAGKTHNLNQICGVSGCAGFKPPPHPTPITISTLGDSLLQLKIITHLASCFLLLLSQSLPFFHSVFRFPPHPDSIWSSIPARVERLLFPVVYHFRCWLSRPARCSRLRRYSRQPLFQKKFRLRA